MTKFGLAEQRSFPRYCCQVKKYCNCLCNHVFQSLIVCSAEVYLKTVVRLLPSPLITEVRAAVLTCIKLDLSLSALARAVRVQPPKVCQTGKVRQFVYDSFKSVQYAELKSLCKRTPPKVPQKNLALCTTLTRAFRLLRILDIFNARFAMQI